MSHPVIWPKKTFFYPIGNTPPVCLTQELSPEQDAQVLLLGCGDPRSILYTIHADLASNRSMDYTCCDWEPAVLARNIILLTMIHDGVAPKDVWPIFYHFYLDEGSYDILRSQCTTLLQASSDMVTWRQSKYGGFLRFCTEQSMSEIRRHWSLYLGLKDIPIAQQKVLKETFTSGMKSIRQQYGATIVMSCIRSAGPLALYIANKGAESYMSFWTTGIAPSNTKRVSRNATPHLNPMFAYSLAGRTFNVHYGTDPILPFHLAPVLASKQGAITIEDLGDFARSQFYAWCTSFKKRTSSETEGITIIRFFVGESLAFCHALRFFKETKKTDTGFYVHPWGAPQITLDKVDYSSSATKPAPSSFNIIETSNLADHVGLLNLLVVTLPLLRREPWAIMHTNTLLRQESSGPATSGLSEAACADIATLSLLLGILPSSHIWHFTTHSNKHEILVSSIMSGQLQETVSWRYISNFVPNTRPSQHNANLPQLRIACDDKKLAKFLFSVYLQMFADENASQNLQKLGDISALKKMSIVHYVRASFAALVAFVKGRVSCNWPDVMDHLDSLLVADRRLLMGSNNYQDLICHLFMHGVHTWDVMTPAHLEAARSPRDRFHGWKNIPPVVCIVLKVPRKVLKPLEDMDADEILTPMLQCESKSITHRFHNVYSSIQLCFGDIDVTTSSEPQVTIHEDQKGWSGTSPLIVTFYMPSWSLTYAPESTNIGLHVRSTPHSISLMPKLGMDLAIYSTSLTDSAHIHVVRYRPHNSHEVDRRPSNVSYVADLQKVILKLDENKTTSLTVKEDIKSSEAAEALKVEA